LRVRGLTADGDWSWGNGKANYKNDSKFIKQSVVTRVKSFKYDWFLDIQTNIDWWNILGQKNNEEIIRSQVYKTVSETEGVTAIKSLEINTNTETRNATITISLKTVFDDIDDLEITIWQLMKMDFKLIVLLRY